jgi:hypothetical protein
VELAPFNEGVDDVLDGGLVLAVQLLNRLELSQKLAILDT